MLLFSRETNCTTHWMEIYPMRCIAFVYRLKVSFDQLGLSGDKPRGITLVAESHCAVSIVSFTLVFFV